MAKAKKTKKIEEVKVEEVTQPLPTLGEATIQQKKIENCEWCFQFDEDEPQVFAWTDELLNVDEEPKVVFTISNIENSFITFQNAETGKKFKIFARELSEKGKGLREKQREALKNFKNDFENGSENKETEA